MLLFLLACNTPPERPVVIRDTSADPLEDTGEAPFPSNFVAGQRLGSSWTRAVLPADYDNDGDIDLFCVNEGASRLWLNDGTGFFSTVPTGFGGDDGRAGAAGDLNGDSRSDVVIATGQGHVQVLVGDGTTFYEQTVLNLGGPRPSSVLLFDVERDGDLDIVVTYNGAGDQLWLNNGTGQFKAAPTAFDAEGLSTHASVLDIDADGDEDLIVFSAFGPNPLFRNDAGDLRYMGRLCDRGTERGVTGDFDGDGDADLICLHPGRGTLKTLLQRAPSEYDTDQSLRIKNANALSLGDIDNDGYPDLAIARQRRNRVYYNRGNGRFIDSGERLGEDGSVEIALADLDGDGDLDLIEANDFARPNQVWFYTPHIPEP